jgi:uncharacterized protein
LADKNLITMDKIEKHSLIKSFLLHLLPGLLIGMVYYPLAPWIENHGFPNVMALILAGIIILIPFQLGYLFYQKKKTGLEYWGEIIPYTKPMKKKEYFIWVISMFLLSGIIFTIFSFTSNHLIYYFKWIPSEMFLHMGLNDAYPINNLVITYILFLIFVVIIIPITEELYFRGYLLPRMPSKLKGYTVIIHSALFALYHTWSPWMFITRTLGVLPLIYLVKQKHNIKSGIFIHCLLNSIDFFIGVAFIISLL